MEWVAQVLPYIDSVSAMAVLGIAFVWMKYIDKEKQYTKMLQDQISSLITRVEKVEKEVHDCETTRAEIEIAFNALKLEHAILQQKYDALRLDFESVKSELRVHQAKHV